MIKVQKIDFDKIISEAKLPVDKILWARRKKIAAG